MAPNTHAVSESPDTTNRLFMFAARRSRGALAWIIFIALGALCWFTIDRVLVDRSPIVVGILHSQTGPMAISEKSMIDAEVLALEQINAAGGLLGRPVEWVIADGASDPATFAKQAEKLVRDDKVCVVFGCWTSASRKSVLPVFESNDHLLVYPMAYEGLEQSPNIIYVGAAPNQQITPAVSWCHSKLSARRYFLIGSDYIWPHCVNAIIADQLVGMGDELVGEFYIPFGSTDVAAAVQAIVAAKPDVVLSTVVGDSAIAFAQKLHAAGIRPEQTPVLTFALGENELSTVQRDAFAGNYAAWNYFQSIESPQNTALVNEFKARFGNDRTFSDVMNAAYSSVLLWAQAVREAGRTEVRQVRYALRHQSLNAAEGIIAVDSETQHTWLPVSIGRIRQDGQFDIVWSSNTAVRPVPFPISRSREEWQKFVENLHQQWGGKWAAPANMGGASGGGVTSPAQIKASKKSTSSKGKGSSR